MIVYRSDRVTAGTAAYGAAKQAAADYAKAKGGRVEWQDEYNDYSVAGRWIVRR